MIIISIAKYIDKKYLCKNSTPYKRVAISATLFTLSVIVYPFFDDMHALILLF